MLTSFTVPSEDGDSDDNPHLFPYPVEARGLTLGTTLYWLLVNVQNRPKFARVLQSLDAIGFPVDVDWDEYSFERQRVPALRKYRELYGDCLVPRSFVVPTGDARWPIETWEFKLGLYCSKFRTSSHRIFTQKRLNVLADLGASWALNELPLAERPPLLAPALQAFQAQHGHFIMPSSIVVPTETNDDPHRPSYPVKARGTRLGATLHRLVVDPRSRAKHSGVLKALDAIGFPVYVDWKEYVFEHQRLSALRKYRELHGNCLVPRNFVVSKDDARWPIETWGFELGDYVRNIRQRDQRHLTRRNWTGWTKSGSRGAAMTRNGRRTKSCRPVTSSSSRL